MSAGPKTIEAARALPEIKSIVDHTLYFGGGGITGETICSFVDADDVSKTVRCIRRTPDGPDEWVKVRM